MKILHTADLHLGQVLYQHYERGDEHAAVFDQLTEIARRENPDALVVCGDVFDIQQPSARVWREFNDRFVDLRRAVPDMQIVITAGNHDSPSRLHASASLWDMAGVRVIGLPPGRDFSPEEFVVQLPTGFIVGVPFLGSGRTDGITELLKYVSERNADNLPVVVMAHMAVTGSDFTGHDFDIGTLRAVELDTLGKDYDYLALGHIHRPQTIGHTEDMLKECVTYHAPVARYSGSPLHISADEAYPHTISIVDLERHGGTVTIRQEKIRQLRHFHIIPTVEEVPEGLKEASDGITALEDFASNGGSGYVRLRLNASTWLPSDFPQRVYDALEPYGDRVRYNPRTLWVGGTEVKKQDSDEESSALEIIDIQEMTDPMTFIEATLDRYDDINLDELRDAFREIETEVRHLHES